MFIPVEGSTFSELPPWALESATEKVERDTLTRPVVVDTEGRSVWRDGRRIAVAVAVSIDDGYGRLPNFERNYVTAVLRASPHQTITLAGQDVTYYPDAHGVQKLSVYRNGILLSVMGETRADRGELEQVLTALLPNLPQ